LLELLLFARGLFIIILLWLFFVEDK
jgi:hypothetical protein